MSLADALTVGGAITARAERDPDRVFLVSPELSRGFTAGEVHRATLALQAQLVERGVRPRDRVSVVLSNGPNLVVALLGVMSAGAVAVPLNPKLTLEELTALRADAGVKLVVTDVEHRAGALGEGGSTQDREVRGLVPGNPLILGGSPKGQASKIDAPGGPENAALILHTSGSTGRPKGVPLTHRNLLANARQVVAAHRLSADDVALCVLPIFHINGLVVTALAPLLSGGSVVMPRRFDAERFWGWVSEHRATWFSAVPTILSRLLSRPAPVREHFASLRFARSASAALPVPLQEEFEARFGVPVIESFGISEGAGQVTSNPLPPAPRKPGSVGIAWGNEVRIVDETGRRSPAGATGEVAVRGENVFSGYLDRPDADRESLRDGWLLTGDLGHVDSDGYLFLTGRRKEIINRAGEKISPREVEEVLHRRGEVEVACVLGVPDAVYGEEIVAFISLRPGREIAAETLTAHCREHLASFKVPRHVFFVEDFPRGPNGKLQRRGLIDVFRALMRQRGGAA
jgi:acyl-CoA synthetase (AMP-forming)/AMP-acid ligase II